MKSKLHRAADQFRRLPRTTLEAFALHHASSARESTASARRMASLGGPYADNLRGAAAAHRAIARLVRAALAEREGGT